LLKLLLQLVRIGELEDGRGSHLDLVAVAQDGAPDDGATCKRPRSSIVGPLAGAVRVQLTSLLRGGPPADPTSAPTVAPVVGKRPPLVGKSQRALEAGAIPT
jgi:hypothetical protein